MSNGPYSRTKPKRNSDGDDNDNEDGNSHPDLGLRGQPQSNKKVGNEYPAGSNETPRREENPFSFKHFLSRDATNGQGGNNNTGAKPKVFTSPIISHSPDLDCSRNSSSRSFAANPDLASALPDFVQDHLVVEQCFLRDASSSALTVDIDNLPDFAMNQDGSSNTSGNPRCRQINFNNFSRARDRNQNCSMDGVPLDLPNVPNASPVLDLPSSGVLPFDLPLVRDASNSNAICSNSLAGSPVQPTVSKSLPDFLSDGPIRGGHLPPADVTAEASGVSQNHLVEDRFQTENERLRAEVEILRSQNSELSRRVQLLQTEVRTLRAKEHEDVVSMERAVEQAEENLQRTMKRAVNAENMVSKLRQDLRQTQSELRTVQQNNWELRGGEGSSACGGAGAGASSSSSGDQIHMRRFAQELKAAASTAESSLRQLLSGVDNLRLLASSMETIHRVEDKSTDYVSDLDDTSGPTL